ncbi:hypothetical protein E4U39_000091 [Claviceps sp. Clav50 group G5]|nr:hypothetical protein E4U39_000091 [Claviceps sp. Clav50 group G5]
MPGSQSTPPAAAPTSLGDNKTIKFEIKTGNARWRVTPPLPPLPTRPQNPVLRQSTPLSNSTQTNSTSAVY